MVNLVIKRGAFRDAIFPPRVRWSLVGIFILISFFLFYRMKTGNRGIISLIIAIILLIIALFLTYDEIKFRLKKNIS
jgi:cell division protein FtsW (lipid II flippase)